MELNVFSDREGVYVALLSLQGVVALILGFSVFHGHRTLIPAIAILQAIWFGWQGQDVLEPRLQLVGFLVGSVMLFRSVRQVRNRLSPTLSTSSYTVETSRPGLSSKRFGPWLLPCKTSHTRQFPKKHGFAYTYLQVAFRVGPSSTYGGSLLGIETKTELGDPWTWFSISADTYLFRGPGPDGTLYGKLREYLKTEDVDIEDVPNVFLVTAPKFLGYSFNPVSFWYLYDREKNLKYMLLEVNNTFDERRLYLLDRQQRFDADFDGEKLVPAEKPKHFRQTWSKDFHVSPFNSRKGSYSLMAQDPGFMNATAHESAAAQIDNTITLRSSKSHSKLVARLFSTGPAVHAESLTFMQKIYFVASWCWVGFVTFPRILKEAGKLFFARGLHVWFRPEVLRSSIGRQATWRETAIGELFGYFLQRQCRGASATSEGDGVAIYVPLRYTHSLAVPGPRTWYLGIADAPATSVEASRAKAAIKMQVLSPVFYAQYNLDSRFLRKELPAEELTVSVLGAGDAVPPGLPLHSTTDDTRAKQLVTNLLEKGPSQRSAGTASSKEVSWRWRILRGLRHGVSENGVHPMDEVVHDSYCRATDPETKRKAEGYRKAVLGLLIADKITFGSPELLDGFVWIFTTVTTWLGVSVVGQAATIKEPSYPAALAAAVMMIEMILK